MIYTRTFEDVFFVLLGIIKTKNLSEAFTKISISWSQMQLFYLFKLYCIMVFYFTLSTKFPEKMFSFFSLCFKCQVSFNIYNKWLENPGNTLPKFRSSPPELFLEKDVLKIGSKFTGEHPCQSAISIKLQSSFS